MAACRLASLGGLYRWVVLVAEAGELSDKDDVVAGAYKTSQPDVIRGMRRLVSSAADVTTPISEHYRSAAASGVSATAGAI